MQAGLTHVAEVVCQEGSVLQGFAVKEVQHILVEEAGGRAHIQARLLPHSFWIKAKGPPPMPATTALTVLIMARKGCLVKYGGFDHMPVSASEWQ